MPERIIGPNSLPYASIWHLINFMRSLARDEAEKRDHHGEMARLTRFAIQSWVDGNPRSDLEFLTLARDMVDRRIQAIRAEVGESQEPPRAGSEEAGESYEEEDERLTACSDRRASSRIVQIAR